MPAEGGTMTTRFRAVPAARRRSVRPAGAALVVGAGLLVAAAPAAAQTEARSTAEADVPAAHPEDVESIEAILGAVYDAISGPAGEARNWDRFRSLFLPEARLVPTGRAPDGTVRYLVWTPDEYIRAAGDQLEANGFFEREAHRVVERFATSLTSSAPTSRSARRRRSRPGRRSCEGSTASSCSTMARDGGSSRCSGRRRRPPRRSRSGT
jgi:hypothetical protein